MSASANENLDGDGLVFAAREILRSEGNTCIFSIFQLLEELTDKHGDCFSVSPETYEVLQLIETLWEDPHIDQVPNTGSIEFAWRQEVLEVGESLGFERLRAILRRPQILPAVNQQHASVPLSVTQACVNLIRDSGAEGTIFPHLADLVIRSPFGINPIGEETMLFDPDHLNTVCWNGASRAFLDVINRVLDHPGIQMVRTRTERYYDYGVPPELCLTPTATTVL